MSKNNILYGSNGINGYLCLKELDILPFDVILLIIDLYLKIIIDPVMIIITADWCIHSQKLLKSKFLEEIIKVYPCMRFHQIKCETNYYQITHLSKFIPTVPWYPMIVLVPNSLWDKSYLEIDDDTRESIQVMNGIYIKDSSDKYNCLAHIDCSNIIYNNSDPIDHIKWIRNCLNNSKFLHFQIT